MLYSTSHTNGGWTDKKAKHYYITYNVKQIQESLVKSTRLSSTADSRYRFHVWLYCLLDISKHQLWLYRACVGFATPGADKVEAQGQTLYYFWRVIELLMMICDFNLVSKLHHIYKTSRLMFQRFISDAELKNGHEGCASIIPYLNS